MEYPQTFRNEDGVELIAMNEVQAAAFENGGFYPVEEPTKRKKKE